MKLTPQEALFSEESCQRLRDGDGIVKGGSGVTPFGRSGARGMACGQGDGGGAQIGKRRLRISLRKSTFIPVNPYVHRHFERWQGNWIHREPQATENPVTRFPSGVSMLSDKTGKNRYSFDESRNLPGK